MNYSTEFLNGLGAFPAALVPAVANIASGFLPGLRKGVPIEKASFEQAAMVTASMEGSRAAYIGYVKAGSVAMQKAPFELRQYIETRWKPSIKKASTFWRDFVADMKKLASQQAANQGNPFAIAASTGQKASNVINSQIAQVNNPPAINQTASPSISTRAGFGGSSTTTWIITGLGTAAFIALMLMGAKKKDEAFNNKNSK
ncbi:MAG: hypothetical protein AAF843_20155 [Bacteroidota bacterium]